jgi:hypothetical protein
VLGFRLRGPIERLEQAGRMLTPESATNGWVRIGTVDVESGTLLLVDPAFHRDGQYGPTEVAAAIEVAVKDESATAALKLADPQDYAAGVVVVTGLGDDVYPVEARYEVGPRGIRYVAEMRVRFAVDDDT